MTRSRSAESFLPLTPLSTAVLLAVAGGARHGYAMLKEMEERGDGRVPGAGSLYAALERMVDEGLLEEREREEGSAGGPRRRCYGVTDLGREVVRLEMERMTAVVALAAERRLIGEGPAVRPGEG